MSLSLIWDAWRAEAFRLFRNRMLLFWSVLFVPIFGLILSTGGNLFMSANRDRLSQGAGDRPLPPEVAAALSEAPIKLGEALVKMAAEAGNPAVLLFVLIGAATLYAGDYRWETWRLISARNARANLLLGKVGVLKTLALLAMAAFLIAGVIETGLKAAIYDRGIEWVVSGAEAGRFLAFALLSLIGILQFTAVGLLTAVASRSLLATLFVPLVVAVGQFFALQVLRPLGVGPDDWAHLLVNPGAGFSALQALITGGTAAQMLEDGLVLKGVVSIALWTLGPIAAALALFQRQDLSKE